MCGGDPRRVEGVALDDPGALLFGVFNRALEERVRDTLAAMRPRDEEAEDGPGRRPQRRHPRHGSRLLEANVRLARRDRAPADRLVPFVGEYTDGCPGADELLHLLLLLSVGQMLGRTD